MAPAAQAGGARHARKQSLAGARHRTTPREIILESERVSNLRVSAVPKSSRVSKERLSQSEEVKVLELIRQGLEDGGCGDHAKHLSECKLQKCEVTRSTSLLRLYSVEPLFRSVGSVGSVASEIEAALYSMYAGLARSVSSSFGVPALCVCYVNLGESMRVQLRAIAVTIGCLTCALILCKRSHQRVPPACPNAPPPDMC